jgi:energy-converting hydrogenase Eha subunit A
VDVQRPRIIANILRWGSFFLSFYIILVVMSKLKMLAGARHWNPFRLDALGIVTLIGADEMNMALGRLSPSLVSEPFPLIGSYVVAGNKFMSPITGFHLFNITDGIVATDLSAWFTRRLLAHNLTYSTSTILISHSTQLGRPRPRRGQAIAWLIVCMLPCLLLAVFAVLMRDFWGVANALAMLISVLVRKIAVMENCAALDRNAEKARATSEEMVKAFLTLPNGLSATLITSRGIIINCLLTEPRPLRPKLYSWICGIGWIGFATHVVSLGMAALVNQIISVTLLIAGTILVAKGVGEDDSEIGSSLIMRQIDSIQGDFRAVAYARLGLSPTEEESMLAWNLFPHKSNANAS